MAAAFGCGPADIKAAIGPCISKCCYETDEDVAQALPYGVSRRSEGKFVVDLKEANRLALIEAGVLAENIAVSDECTMCRGEGKYWSHRLTKGHRGSQASIITLKGNAPK
jgi:hypothetical protein